MTTPGAESANQKNGDAGRDQYDQQRNDEHRHETAERS
jgi:hypothetical protein